MKTCKRCGESKPLDQFYRRADAKDGLQRVCKSCNRELSGAWVRRNPERHARNCAAWNKANPESRKAIWSRWASRNQSYLDGRRPINDLKRAGLTPEEYGLLSAIQDNRCAICNALPSGSRLHIDHDHDTGDYRGLLCTRCNPGLGFFQDDPAILRIAADYVEFHRGK